MLPIELVLHGWDLAQASGQHLHISDELVDYVRGLAETVVPDGRGRGAFAFEVTPAEAAPPTPEQMEAVMGEWNAWAGKVGAGMVDFGTPLAGGTRVSRDGVSPSTRDVVGYSLIEATDFDAALELARIHPHLNMPGGCEIEVHEAQAIPGV